VNRLVRAPKDFIAGLIYISIGLAAIVIGWDYKMGTALQMGPAYFPTVLGCVLAGIGLISLVRAFLRDGEPVAKFAWKPLLIIVGATVVFGLLVRGAGLLIALPLFVLMTARASIQFRWVTALALAAGATLFCSLVFVQGLGVPLPLIGRWLRGMLA
jgi:hypothetical protein